MPNSQSNQVIRPDVQSISAYPAPYVAAHVVKLDAMENPYTLPAEIQHALAQRLSHAVLNRYPPAHPERLYQALRHAFDIPKSASVLLGNGSDELIHLIIQTCCEPDDVVLSPWPSFVMYDLSARFNHARFVGVDLQADLTLDLAAILAAIKRTKPKVVFLAYPNNPTGALWSDSDIEQIIRATPGLVVIDEAYQPFALRSWINRVMEFPNVVLVRTLSKLGLAGIRLGYLTGAVQWLEQIDKVRPPYNINIFTQIATEFLLEHRSIFDFQAQQLCLGRTQLSLGLAASSLVQQVYPSAANFVLVRLNAVNADHHEPQSNLHFIADHVTDELKKKDIWIKNFSRVHPLLNGCLRISIGTEQDIAAVLLAFEQIRF